MKLIYPLIALAIALAGLLSIIGDRPAQLHATVTSITLHHRTVLNTPIRGHRSLIIYGLPKDARNNYVCKLGRYHALYCTKDNIPIYPN